LGGATDGCFGGEGCWAPLGGPFLSFSVSPCACANLSGAFCACVAKPANCIAESVVVASSTRRSLVMAISIPGMIYVSRRSDQQTGVRPQCGSAFAPIRIYFAIYRLQDAASFIAHSDAPQKQTFAPVVRQFGAAFEERSC
jgi:hypothetical protein